MTTEYMLEPGQSHEELARDLLEQAESPDQVHWSPRPDVPGGGVYLLADAAIAERVRAVRAARRTEEAARIADSLAAAEKRDSNEDVASGLLTPGEAGFPADRVVAAPEDEEPEDDEDDVSTEDDPATPEDESKMTPAQKRAATKKAKQDAAAQAAANAPADQEKSE
jgi:hypothetical protein